MRSSRLWAGLVGPGLLLAGLGVGAPACTTEAACFRDCTDQAPMTDGGSAGTANGGNAGTLTIGLGGDGTGTSGKQSTGGSAALEDGGTECDTADLQTDVNNCGACAQHCVITGADSKCVKGKCQIAACLATRYDQNGDPSDGCELVCDGDPMADEVCNGEDDNCDGQRDEGFDLTADVDNCGVCGNVCNLLHATSACTAGECKIDECDDGWYSVDGLNSTGCEYPCQLKDKLGADCDPATAPAADGCGVEVCDDIDQNCNGQINEVSADADAPCSDFCPTKECYGTCTFGKTQCIGSILVCLPGVTPTLDICDGLDNNCDDQVDEDFDFDSDPQHCGDCNTSCVGTLPHALAKCEQKQCQIDVCETDYGDLDKAASGCELCPVRPVRTESCNGKDDDCNGIIDDPAAVAANKPASGAAAGVNSFCKQKAGTLCNDVPLHCDSNAGGWLCDYPTGVERAAGKVVITEGLCDGIDGNCDGQKDEAFLDLGKSCNDGAFGVCLDYGKTQCDLLDSSKTYCNTTLPPDPPMASAEVCNGLDDNCDGQVDEGTDQMVEIKRGSLDFWIDKYEASRPDATVSTAGTDESHLCGIPNRLPWTGATFDEAQGACQAGGKRLCHIAELQEACVGATNRTFPYGNTYVAANCNGIDAPGSAAAPTGSFPSCVSSDGVYDLSGNVSEWSDNKSGSTTGSPKYDIMDLQGGSYLTPFNGLTCTFDFDVISTNAVLPSLGFRCCKDGP
jgi:sulfatase-modifying factor enzyme 1/putative metal-binding protein